MYFKLLNILKFTHITVLMLFVISSCSKVDDNSVKIGNNCVIGRGVKIGSNSIIKNNVVIKNSILSKNIIISDNTTIGCTGFGFDLSKMGSSNLNPHVGIVYIDDYVNIGSNCTIDRAKIDITSIGKNSMIDNLVHIAHNVKLGKNGCIAAQTGISGSTVLGNNLIVGGQSGFAGHLSVGDNVVVAAKSGVTKNIKSNFIKFKLRVLRRRFKKPDNSIFHLAAVEPPTAAGRINLSQTEPNGS